MRMKFHPAIFIEEMTHLYDTVEPNVLSRELLRGCVLAQGPEGEAGRLSKEEGIEFSAVRHLRLDFQNILRIENLWQFSGLRKLQLDNNIIEQIEGLESLVQLEWLDLSFNNIEEVGGGLEALVGLRDLSLAHNRLTEVAGFATLTRLQSLSLASNRLDDLQQVSCLRPLASLQSLCLSGNPLTSDPSYQHYALAFLPSLVYLDFSMVFTEEREAACAMFSEALVEVELVEREADRKREELAAAQHLQGSYKASYVDGLQGSVLYDTMMAEDSDAKRIALLPGVADMLRRLKDEFMECCEHLTKVGMEEMEKREAEVSSFQLSHQQACSLGQQRSVQAVAEYEEVRNKMLSSRGPGELSPLEDALSSLERSLMRTETTLVEQLDEVIKDFERNYSDMVGNFLESVQAHMTQLRDKENTHHERATEIGLQYLESAIKGTLEEEPPEELRKLLSDKDTLVSALNAAHDGHLLTIDAKEDSIAHRSKSDLTRLLDGLGEAELTRNRQKVTETRQYLQTERREMDAT